MSICNYCGCSVGAPIYVVCERKDHAKKDTEIEALRARVRELEEGCPNWVEAIDILEQARKPGQTLQDVARRVLSAELDKGE